MALFVVGYDLKNADTIDYKNLTDAIEALDSAHTQESVWYVAYSGTATNLRDHLKPHIHEDDRLMVVEFTKKPAWTKAMSGTQAWIDKHFP